MIDSFLNQMSILIRNNIMLAPFFAFIGGFITSFSPCSLSNIPLLIAYLSGTKNSKTSANVKLSILYSLGMSVTFVILGIIVSFAGGMLGRQNKIINIMLGILMIVLSLQICKVINILPSFNINIKIKIKGYLGAFICGLVGGIMTSPCSTPVLIAILSILMQKKDIVYGTILMMSYSIGHSALLILAGFYIGFVKEVNANKKFNFISKLLNNLLGILVFLLGIYIIYINIF